MPKFTVDTHLFRELGALLVGRDSTALVELIKNAYDADSKEVTIEGKSLGEPNKGKITITDNGIGMTAEIFEKGFLRIASRLREEGDKRSPIYQRRFTGAKGVGRLAAHKLSRHLRIVSVPDRSVYKNNQASIDASIDWDKIEEYTTIDEIEATDAIKIDSKQLQSHARPGTTLELTRLRRKWTPEERARFFWEVQTFRPPDVLLDPPSKLFKGKLLLSDIQVADSVKKDPGIAVKLTGDFEVGEEYWQALASVAAWLIEIDAVKEKNKRKVRILISPTAQCLKKYPDAKAVPFTIDYPSDSDGPYFQARILIREGQVVGTARAIKTWIGRMIGIRVYMEGFRVLPYGDVNDDWLGLDSEYRRRSHTLSYLENLQDVDIEKTGEDEGLSFLGNPGYFGAIFLTQNQSADLQMVVNREGFIPNAAFDVVKHIVRIATDLSVRVRAAVSSKVREERSRSRREKSTSEIDRETSTPRHLKTAVSLAVEKATSLARRAKEEASAGRVEVATELVERAAAEFKSGAEISDRLLTEPAMTRMLAAIGIQMASFVHEINGLLAMARSLETAISRIREMEGLNSEARKSLAGIATRLGDLRRSVERQASYLTDITAPDARRRRSKQVLADRFDTAVKLILPGAERLNVKIENNIPPNLKSLAMFPAELTLIFSNLLTNAIKAAGENGHIRVTSKEEDGHLSIRVENTGVEIDLSDAERWFRPFESTTTKTDPYLGQGMGMGLPITRNMLEEYGAEIKFVKPSRGFSTAVQIMFPED